VEYYLRLLILILKFNELGNPAGIVLFLEGRIYRKTPNVYRTTGHNDSVMKKKSQVYTIMRLSNYEECVDW
jgi:hypothetical protein